MNTRLPSIILSLLLGACVSLSCGMLDPEMVLSGSVDVSEIQPDIEGTIFLAVTTTSDLQEIEKDPLKTIALIAAVDGSTYEFRMDLSDTGLEPGDDVFVLGFVDNDYSNGIPYPSEGDFVGFYVDRDSLSMNYKLREGNNSLTVKINRRVYDFDATISGTIEGTEKGDVLLIAYAGELTSLDLDTIDIDAVIGYQHFKKGSSPLSYTLDILPYGKNIPIGGVYLFGVLDRNGNGSIDAGDMLGWYSGNGRGIPTTFTVDAGDTPGKDLSLTREIAAPSPYPVSLLGSFVKPSGYDGSPHPVFIIIAQTEDLTSLFTNTMDVVRYFVRMPAGENTFNIDLTSSGCMPGDRVMVIALWDLDSTGCFPDLTPGDLAGYVVNPESFSYRVTLAKGENTVPEYGYEFILNRKIYEHSSSINFQLEQGVLEDGDFSPDDPVMVVALHRDGVDIINRQIDIDYVLGMTTVTADFSRTFNLPILSAIYEGVTVNEPFSIDNASVLAILDRNANGSHDTGEQIGYYWYTDIFGWIYYPKYFTLNDGLNTLDRTVRFSILNN